MVYASCPNVPYEKNFKCEIKPGFQLVVTGQILEDYCRGSETPAIRGFDINLRGESRFDGDIILHFNPRFDDSVVVLNSLQGGEWGSEERPSQYPFNSKHEFSIVFQAHSDEFKIFVNGNHFTDYKYRQPITSVTGLTIGGQVIVHQVITSKHEVGNFPPPLAPGDEPIIYLSELPLTIKTPEAKTNIGIPGNLQPGLIFGFVGKSPEDANQFSINWLTHSGDVAFHFNPRFEDNVVVRNTKTEGQWGAEEREHESPFKRDTKFQIFVKVHASHYEVWVNGSHFCDYQHRIQPLSEVNAFDFVGDVKLKVAKITF